MAATAPTRTIGWFLRQGVAAGSVAGVATALATLLLVEPPLRAALVIEESRPTTAGEAAPELVGRTVQVAGGMVAAVVVGMAVGVVFAVVFAKARHVLPGSTDLGRSAALASAGFAVFALLPALKYPANPPGVGDPATVSARTWMYASLLVAGVLIAVTALALQGSMRRRHRELGPRTVLVATLIVIATGLVLWAWPATPDSVPSDVPASLLWQFRVASLGQLAVLWGVLGLGSGLLFDREGSRARPTGPGRSVASPVLTPPGGEGSHSGPNQVPGGFRSLLLVVVVSAPMSEFLS
ncbi:MAG: CbtA family protein [Pseudonocardiaceae bacterium]